MRSFTSWRLAPRWTAHDANVCRSAPERGLPRGAEAVEARGPEDEPLIATRTAGQDRVGSGVQRHFTALSVLGLLEEDHPARTVNPVPGQFKGLALAEPGEEAELDEIEEVRVP